MMVRNERCEADTYYGGVCGGSLHRQWTSGPLVCTYASSHLVEVAEPVVRNVGASPSAPYYVIGSAVLLTPVDYHEMSQYPGADRMLTAQPQTVLLSSNGYYCAMRVTGTITGRGYYGGKIGVVETYVSRPYSYEVVEALTERDGMSKSLTVRYELLEGVQIGEVLVRTTV
jgi:hypothetical protein